MSYLLFSFVVYLEKLSAPDGLSDPGAKTSDGATVIRDSVMSMIASVTSRK